MNDKIKHFIATAAITLLVLTLFADTITAQSFTPIHFDKKYHIGAGTLAGVWGTFAGKSIELSDEGAALFGVAAATAAGIGKEVMDVAPALFGNETARFDCMDIAATVEGGIIGAGLTYLGMKIFKRKPLIYGGKGITIGFKVNF